MSLGEDLGKGTMRTPMMARQRWLHEPYPVLLTASLILAVVGGFGVGLALLLSFTLRIPLDANMGAMIQVHGQVQAFGFLALLVIAVGTRLLPRFHGTHLRHGALVTAGGLVLASGVVLRALSQPLPDVPFRSASVLASGLLILAGVLLAFTAFGRTIRGGKRRERREPVVLPLTMAGSLFGALVLNLVASVGLAQGGSFVPYPIDNALVHLELWGFASTMVLAIARHTWPNLLLLQPGHERWVLPGLGLWAIGSLGIPLAWLLVPEVALVRTLAALAQFAGAVLYAYSLRLFAPPLRASSIPRITNPARAWMRMAFGFLLLGAAANVLIALGADFRSLATFVITSAARHALAQGFLLPVIVFMAARILPGYSAAMVRHPGRLAVLMWTLFGAAALRVGGEMIGGYAPGWNLVVAAGGTLGTAVFIVFAVALGRSTLAVTANADPRAIPTRQAAA
jgi:hypothetical protein